MICKMAMASLVDNANCLCISVLKCGKVTSHGITNEVFILEAGYRSSD